MTIRVLTRSRTGPVRVKPSWRLELVEGLGHLRLGDGRQVELAAGSPSAAGTVGREDVLDRSSSDSFRPKSAAPLATASSGSKISGSMLELGDDPVADLRHPGRAADQDDLVELGVSLRAGVGEHLVGQLDGAVEQVLGDLLELGALELDAGLLAGVGHAERRLVALGERLLAPLGLEEQVVQDLGVVHRVGLDAGLGAELLGQVDDDRLVPEGAAEPVVAAGADDADQPVLDLDHRDVEGAAAEVVDQDGLVLALLESVGDGRRRSAR